MPVRMPEPSAAAGPASAATWPKTMRVDVTPDWARPGAADSSSARHASAIRVAVRRDNGDMVGDLPKRWGSRGGGARHGRAGTGEHALARETHTHGRAGALAAVEFKAAAVQFDELTADGEAEARAAEAPRDRRIGLIEGLGQVSHDLGRHADAGVRYPDGETAVGGRLDSDRHPAARRRELDRVRQDIEQDLLNGTGVGAHHRGGELRPANHLDAALRDARRHQREIGRA